MPFLILLPVFHLSNLNFFIPCFIISAEISTTTLNYNSLTVCCCVMVASMARKLCNHNLSGFYPEMFLIKLVNSTPRWIVRLSSLKSLNKFEDILVTCTKGTSSRCFIIFSPHWLKITSKTRVGCSVISYIIWQVCVSRP